MQKENEQPKHEVYLHCISSLRHSWTLLDDLSDPHLDIAFDVAMTNLESIIQRRKALYDKHRAKEA